MQPPGSSEGSSHIAWRDRAQQALFDVEILRHELLESKAREAALVRSIGSGGGVEGSPADGGGGGGRQSRRHHRRHDSVSSPWVDSNASSPPGRPGSSFVSEPSGAGTLTISQVPFPVVAAGSASEPTQATTRSDSAAGWDRSDGLGPLSHHGEDDPQSRTRAAAKDSLASSLENQTSGEGGGGGGGVGNRLSAMLLFQTDFVSPLMNQTMNFMRLGRAHSVVDVDVDRDDDDGDEAVAAAAAAKSSFGSGMTTTTTTTTGTTGSGSSELSSPLKGRSEGVRSWSALGFPRGTTTTTTTRADSDSHDYDAEATRGRPLLGTVEETTQKSRTGGGKVSSGTVGTTSSGGFNESTTTTSTTMTTTTTATGDGSVDSMTLVYPELSRDNGVVPRRGGGGPKLLRKRDEAFLSDLTTATSTATSTFTLDSEEEGGRSRSTGEDRRGVKATWRGS